MSTDLEKRMSAWTDSEYTYIVYAAREELPKLLADHSLCEASLKQHISTIAPFAIRKLKTNRPSIWTQSEGSLRRLKKIRPDEAIRCAELCLEEFVQSMYTRSAIDKVVRDSLNRAWYGAIAESGEEVAVYPDVFTSPEGLTVTFTSFYRRMPTIPLVSRCKAVSRRALETAGFVEALR